MALACVVLPTELVSRELDAAESAVSRLEHLDHLVFEVQDTYCVQTRAVPLNILHLHRHVGMKEVQHILSETGWFSRV